MSKKQMQTNKLLPAVPAHSSHTLVWVLLQNLHSNLGRGGCGKPMSPLAGSQRLDVDSERNPRLWCMLLAVLKGVVVLTLIYHHGRYIWNSSAHSSVVNRLFWWIHCTRTRSSDYHRSHFCHASNFYQPTSSQPSPLIAGHSSMVSAHVATWETSCFLHCLHCFIGKQ